MAFAYSVHKLSDRVTFQLTAYSASTSSKSGQPPCAPMEPIHGANSVFELPGLLSGGSHGWPLPYDIYSS